MNCIRADWLPWVYSSGHTNWMKIIHNRAHQTYHFIWLSQHASKEVSKWIMQRMHSCVYISMTTTSCTLSATKEEITWINNKSMHFCVTDYVRLTSFNHFAVILIRKSCRLYACVCLYMLSTLVSSMYTAWCFFFSV